jgi:c-di-GMP-binding flagellar brake protein YcgR
VAVKVAPMDRQIDKQEEGASETTLPGYITELGKTALVLALETEKGLPVRISESALPPPGGSLLVTLPVEGGQLCFETQVLDVRTAEASNGRRLLTLARPFWLARIQRRQHVRTELYLPATFQRLAALEAETNTELPSAEKSVQVREAPPLHGTVLDLSAGGLRADVGDVLGAEEAEGVVTKFAPNTILRVRLPIPTLSGSLLLVRVRACERTARRGGIGVRLACEFLPMPSWDQESLVAHVFQTQRKQRQARAQYRNA